MMWESIFLFCFGIYLLISFYLIKFKKKLFLINQIYIYLVKDGLNCGSYLLEINQ
jgi:hypothetical protein